MVGVLFSSTNKSNFSGLGKSNSTERVNPQSVPTVKWFREVKFLAVPPLLTCKMENLYVSIQGSKVDDCVSKIICCKCASSTVTCGAGQNDITCWQGLEIYSSVTQFRRARIRRNSAKLQNWPNITSSVGITRVMDLVHRYEYSTFLVRWFQSQV